MVYDSIANALIPTPASNSKDLGKKKRVNRTAKLKQSKLDVRREQWLSQVKNRGLRLKEETKVSGGVKRAGAETHAVNERDGDGPMVKLEVSVGGEENEGLGLMNHYSDSESPSNSPTNFTGSSSRSSSASSSSSGCRGRCFSRSMTDEDDGDRDDNDNGNDDDDDDDCLDDWETMADALAADDIQKNHDEHNVESPVHETTPEPESVREEAQRASNGFRAWRPDDVSRPPSLPNLLKQNSFPMKSGLHHGFIYAPSSCPICCEDLDMTDSSFLPCPCGYRLCLFCHKRILEDNGRCPGCRKQYDQTDNKTVTFKLARSYSVNPRH